MQRQEIERNAFETYLKGYHCAEIISKTIIEAYGEGSACIPRVASGFGGGIKVVMTADNLLKTFLAKHLTVVVGLKYPVGGHQQNLS